uniref:AlNc14C69G4795 protein n=1 Tax=Albugo laibachii Nc14 TaxID=890382 RepID=F0WDS7_9STRA|nr:AlNc14C69G4795 [Albugo laibachii Nc14]|eukprot:CCA19354.1 AlNc14C69G4795 [Albugo laibachii Nc14]
MSHLNEERHGELLTSTQKHLEAQDREIMNLKMENAHLRERLRVRLGGDVNTMELEQENSVLRDKLRDSEDQMRQFPFKIRTLEEKHQKAIANLRKLDQAWKKSLQEVYDKQKVVSRLEECLSIEKESLLALQNEWKSEKETLGKLVKCQEELIYKLEDETKEKAMDVNTLNQTVQQMRLYALEQRKEIDTLTQQTKDTDAIAKEKYDQVKNELQKALEDAASLRGQTAALVSELAVVNEKALKSQSTATETTNKLFQGKEELASITVRYEMVLLKLEEKEKLMENIKQQLDNVLKESNARDHTIIHLENQKMHLELEKSDLLRSMDNAVRTRDHEMRKWKISQENEWKEQERKLVVEQEKLRFDLQEITEERDGLKHEQNEALRRLSKHSKSQEFAAHLLTAIQRQLDQYSALVDRHSVLEERVENQNKQLLRLTSLEHEHSALKLRYEKSRSTLDKILVRRHRLGTMGNLKKPNSLSEDLAGVVLDKSCSEEANRSELEEEPVRKRKLVARSRSGGLIRHVYVSPRYKKSNVR